ncbi:MAG: UDP-glucose 4-epimerase [Solirubrobacteraceae bacterium]|nr:UDP-glucose 4-epimerase [Solirubrobacteraceae bacterium]
MRYLITGGAGFIGSHVVDALVARGDQVVVLDDLSTGRLSNIQHVMSPPQVEFVEGTMLDADLVDDCMRSVDACFHLASAVGVQLIIQRPLDSLLTNVRGNDIVLSAAARHHRRVLFTSTSEVYGKHSAGALREDSDRVLGSPFKSRWAYATAKAFGEALAHSLYRERRLPAVVARLFNTVGPRQSGAYGMVLPRFVRQALVGEDLTVYGNGTQSRCFVHVLDTVQALVMLADSDLALGDVYNVGAEIETPIVELARRVIERAGTNSKIELVPYEEAYEEGFEELGRRHPDTSKLRQLTGWQPARTIDDAIDDVIAHEQTDANVSGRASLAG